MGFGQATFENIQSQQVHALGKGCSVDIRGTLSLSIQSIVAPQRALPALLQTTGSNQALLNVVVVRLDESVADNYRIARFTVFQDLMRPYDVE